MTRTRTIILAGLLLGLPGAAAAQNSNAPANVVTPSPPPREGTVGPEQLRDFALPGTRQGSTPAAEAPAPAPAPRAAPPAATIRPSQPVPARAEPRAGPAQSTTARPAPVETSSPSIRTDTAPVAPPPPTRATPVPLPLPLPQAQSQPADPLPPIMVTQAGTEDSSLLSGWWPWLLVAVLAGVGLALVLRQRRRPALAGHDGSGFERVAQEPAAPVRPAAPGPAPAPAPAAEPAPTPALPQGLVTTRLRPAPAPSPVAPPAPPPPLPGGVVSSRLRAWIEIDLVVREILFDANEALLRVDLIVGNGGTASARDIALEAVATNAGEEQGAELAAFFARPAAGAVAITELGPLSDTILSHELRMPRSAIRAYEAQGRTLFVPVIALSASYRTASSEGRTGAAFLVGREAPGSERLAPLLLSEGPGRLLGLGVRRLDEAVRR